MIKQFVHIKTFCFDVGATSRSDSVIQETESSDSPVSSVIRTSNHHSTMKVNQPKNQRRRSQNAIYNASNGSVGAVIKTMETEI